MEHETEQFLAWYEAEKQKGLVDIKFWLCGRSGDDTRTVEAVFGEVNEALNYLAKGIRAPRGEVF